MAKETDGDSEGIEDVAHADRCEFGEIERLAELMEAHGLEEIDVLQLRGKYCKTKIRLSKIARQRPERTDVPPTASTGLAPVVPSSGPADSAPSPNLADHPGAVPSPMIGTVYLQPQPNSPKFIEIGDAVEEGQTLLIIEAMKTMNHIHAPRAGTIRRILVEDGSIVEYGTALVIIE